VRGPARGDQCLFSIAAGRCLRAAALALEPNTKVVADCNDRNTKGESMSNAGLAVDSGLPISNALEPLDRRSYAAVVWAFAAIDKLATTLTGHLYFFHQKAHGDLKSLT
jgi:hypothetical protein